MTPANAYGPLDRLLHRLAFATRLPQCAAADLEDRVYRRELEAVKPEAPVLITALPRAGTTILLQLLAAAPAFAAHTYREMPFVLCPMLWHAVSGPFQRSVLPRERAHADGIAISPDSPEAFEEVIWMRFWPEHYRGRTIRLWEHCDKEEFRRFFLRHMRKVVALRARRKPTAHRYLSKNNLNIARIPAIWNLLPSAVVVVPFRDPLQHCASLLRQHLRFSAWHAEDRFARRYMAAIGHFDLGADLKPVDFGGWLDARGDLDAHELSFWLDYWVAAYSHLLQHADGERCVLLRLEALTADADTGPLCDALHIGDREGLRPFQGILKGPRDHVVDASSVDPGTLRAARELHGRMRERSLL